jgi:signal peptidase II
MNHRLAGFALLFAVFAADRASKLWIQTRFSPFDVWAVIPGFLNIVHAENPGMAFGLLSNHDSSWRSFLLVGVSLAILVVLGRLLWQSASTGRRQMVALGLVMGGACGNLYDRVLRGAVTDFIDVYVGSYHWPTFNIADSAITVGAILLVLDLWLQRERHSATAPAAGSKAD